MIDKNQQQRIARFVADKATSEAVYTAILDVFLKERAKLDVHSLAAERIAVNLLRDAWRELARYSQKEAEKPNAGTNTAV